MRLYVASSWRNELQPSLIQVLRQAGHEVYDFQHPPGGDHLGFSWSWIDPDWQQWTVGDYIEALEHPIAVAGFESDFGAMHQADGCVLVLPCGRSAHLEAGYFVGAGKPLWVLLDEGEFRHPSAVPAALPSLRRDQTSNTELMYRMAGVANIHVDTESLLESIDMWWPAVAANPLREAAEQALDRIETAFNHFTPEQTDEDREIVAQALWFGQEELRAVLDSKRA